MAQKFLFIFITITLSAISTLNVNAQPLFPAILIFGDSTVDTGNNNYIVSILSPNRADHRPYGKDFPSHKATGRFSNGKLVPDFLAETLGLKESVPPFLDPGLSDKDLITGVSFGSAGSGFDDITSVSTRGISMTKQVEYFKKYIEKIGMIVGEKKAKEIIKKALVVINAGTNDFVINYYDLPTRRLQYNITGYQEFVLSRVQSFIEVISLSLFLTPYPNDKLNKNIDTLFSSPNSYSIEQIFVSRREQDNHCFKTHYKELLTPSQRYVPL